jgi:hypothetical protein
VKVVLDARRKAKFERALKGANRKFGRTLKSLAR